jgi:hypothetical protein
MEDFYSISFTDIGDLKERVEKLEQLFLDRKQRIMASMREHGFKYEETEYGVFIDYSELHDVKLFTSLFAWGDLDDKLKELKVIKNQRP